MRNYDPDAYYCWLEWISIYKQVIQVMKGSDILSWRKEHYEDPCKETDTQVWWDFVRNGHVLKCTNPLEGAVRVE